MHCRTNSAINTETLPYTSARHDAGYPASCTACSLLHLRTDTQWERHLMPAPIPPPKDGCSRCEGERSRRISEPDNATQLGKTDCSMLAGGLPWVSAL